MSDMQIGFPRRSFENWFKSQRNEKETTQAS